MIFIVKRSLCFLLIIFTAAAVAFAAAPQGGASPVLAKIGDRTLTKKELELRLRAFNPDFLKILEEPVQLRAFVERLVQMEVFAQAARDSKIDEREEVRAQLDDVVNGILSQAYLREVCPTPPDPTSAEMEAYYRDHKEAFRSPDTVRARHILINVPEDAGEAAVTASLEKARTVRKRVESGESFWKLAREYSDDPATKFKGGDLGYFTRERMVKPFSDAAFSMKKGETSDPVRTINGFHIIQVEDRRTGEVEAFSAAAPRIRTMLIQQKSQACIKESFEKLKKKYHIEIMP